MSEQGTAAPRWIRWALVGGPTGFIAGMTSKWTSSNAFDGGHDILGGVMLLGGEIVCFGSITAAMVGWIWIVVWKTRKEREDMLEKER